MESGTCISAWAFTLREAAYHAKTNAGFGNGRLYALPSGKVVLMYAMQHVSPQRVLSSFVAVATLSHTCQ